MNSSFMLIFPTYNWTRLPSHVLHFHVYFYSFLYRNTRILVSCSITVPLLLATRELGDIYLAVCIFLTKNIFISQYFLSKSTFVILSFMKRGLLSSMLFIDVISFNLCNSDELERN